MKLIRNFPFIKMNKGIANKVRDGWIWYDFFYNQGMSIWDKIKQPAIVMTALGAMTYFELLPMWVLIGMLPVWFVAWFSLGWIWFRVLKIPQRASVISGSKISHWERRNRQLLNQILRKK